jgi:hypothetical protein
MSVGVRFWDVCRGSLVTTIEITAELYFFQLILPVHAQFL